ncbi:MAG: OmpA family protein, partial [Cytophagales bacterium]|nr:OmpA family protein [Cytophaga sp.]
DMDMCPAVKGPAINKGCPEISSELWFKFDAALADVHFATDSDSLTEGSHSALGMVAALMNANSEYTLKVSGYADSTGTDEHNKILSEKRALKVKNYLISKGVPANRITIAAYGEKMPVASNTTQAGRSKNRRVEFDLVK